MTANIKSIQKILKIIISLRNFHFSVIQNDLLFNDLKMGHLSESGFVDGVGDQDVDVGGQESADEFPPVADPPTVRAAHSRSLSLKIINHKIGSYNYFL